MVKGKKRKNKSLAYLIFFSALLFISALIFQISISAKNLSNIFSKNPLTASIAGETVHSLQLKTINFTSPTPTPLTPAAKTTYSTAVCHIDDYVCHSMTQTSCCGFATIYCAGGKCVGGFTSPNDPSVCHAPGVTLNTDSFCQGACGNNDGWSCWGKPVVYLYPTHSEMINVEIKTKGKIVVSDPNYPAGGWSNVLAKPTGELIYNGKTYSELFYESEIKNSWKPTEGIVIAANDIKTSLKAIIYQLGLNSSESQEFLDFWAPRLKNLNSNYILFSIIDGNTKQANDDVVINPKPDTRIEFIAYFKPLDIPVAVEPLTLPKRPERIGFTEVEWGGTIDSGKILTLF